ncbi:hypothetical protein ACFPL7_22110 [Dongia soli]|uniref:Transcriptional regulator n=1 Tax=Dongia soli TaxID=600628 RepID=A0ABU5E8B9_9PROT|nr:hypothetical protein [Dongia soli]MDY0882285.1 hypothetical protein [Dongia soli]
MGDEEMACWFRGMTVANTVFMGRLADLLIKKGLVTAGELREVIDEGLLTLEARQGGNPDHHSLYEAARLHLENVLAAIDGPGIAPARAQRTTK